MKSFSSLAEFVNLPELLDRVEGDEDLLRELLVLFQEDLPGSRDAMQIAIDRGDLGEIERAAHKLKGMLANLSAKSTVLLAAEIEATARAGNTLKIPELVSAFEAQITAFSVALDSFMASAST